MVRLPGHFPKLLAAEESWGETEAPHTAPTTLPNSPAAVPSFCFCGEWGGGGGDTPANPSLH